MAVDLFYTQIFAGNESLPTAPLINSALTPASFEAFLDGAGFSTPTTPGSTGIYGGRITFSTAKNMAARKYIQFTLMTQQYSNTEGLDTVANGGIRIYFFDASGNYAGFKVYGSGISGYDPNSGDGWMSTYRPPDDPTLGQEWLIERTRTPDYVSGSVNWSAITGCEIHLNIIGASMFASWGNSLYLRWLGLCDPPMATGTAGLIDFYTMTYNGGLYGAEWKWRRHFPRVSYQHYGLAGISYSPKIDFLIGDGSTATTMTETDFAIGFWNIYDIAGYQTLGPQIQLSSDQVRPVVINQAATDSIVFTNGTWSSNGGWALQIMGSVAGIASFIRNTFFRANFIMTNHASFSTCIFDSIPYIMATADTVITESIFRNGPSGGLGLYFTGDPGDYSAFDITFSNNTTYDLSIGSGVAGTYDFSGLKVADGYTLKVFNESETEAITVIVGAGIATSTATLGGTVTIQAPLTNFTVSGIISGSRLLVRRTDTQAVLTNKEITGTSDVYSYSYSGDIPVEVILRNATGIPAYKQFRAVATLGTADYTLIANQELDE